MAGRIPEHILEDILSRVDIVEIIAGSIPLKRSGRNFKACCPFHHEKTPSFMVSADKQIYHCFGCGESGHAFKFLMRHERMEFLEAVEALAQKAGVILPETHSDTSRFSEIKGDLFTVLEAAVRFYAQTLSSPEGARARSYCAKRGITDEKIALFNLGLAPDRWDGLIGYLRGKNFTFSMMEKAGLVLAKEGGGYYDRFRNRVIFPIYDLRNRPVAFGARVLDASLPKYINSPETPLYVKGRQFYGLNWAKDAIRDSDCAVVVEGYLDFCIPYQAGWQNITASLGTALTHEQARLLKRYTQNVVMLYDADAAGQIATLRSLDIFVEEEMHVRVASLPAGFDPDSYVREHGIDNFRLLITQAQDLFDYKLRMLKNKFPKRDPHSTADIASAMLETIVKIKNAVLKAEYMRKLSQELDVREDALLTEARKVKDVRPSGEVPQTARKQSIPVTSTDKLLVKLLLEEAHLIERLRDTVEAGDFQDSRTWKIISALLSRAGEGKSVDASTLMQDFPDEEITHIVCESVFEGEGLLPEQREQAFEDCLKRLKTQRIKLRRESLHEQIKTAQRTGDEEELKKLMEEFHSLIKENRK